MADYTYTGIDKTGKAISGKISATSPNEVRMNLRALGIRPTKITKTGALNTDLSTLLKLAGGTTIPKNAIVIFTRQMHVLINSGIPLMQALEMLTEQAATPGMRLLLEGMKDRVAKGSYFWESLAAYPNNFPKLYIALIRAGEASGSLDQMLKRLSRYLEDSERMKKMIKGAMAYPIIVITLSIGVIFIMLAFVIPKMEEMLKGSKQELPEITQFIVNTSHFVVNNFLLIVGILVTSIVILLKYSKTHEGRAMMDQIFFRVPLFGNIMRLGGIARFCRTLQTLLISGVNLIDAIDICRQTIDNVVLERATSRIRTDIEKGQTLGMAISKIKEFPKMTYQMVQVGESTGSLDKMLEKIADFYEADVEALIAGISKMIEPLILIFLGGTVGTLLIAMYMPIFKMAGSAGGTQ